MLHEELKDLVARFDKDKLESGQVFAKRLRESAKKLVEKDGYTNEDIALWLVSRD